jgi:RNA polymerase sigma factor (sigma-70 family)
MSEESQASLENARRPNQQYESSSSVIVCDAPDAPEPHADLNVSSTFARTRDELYSEFQPLVRRLLRQYGSTAEARSDLAGEIYYRFCALLEAYDPERGVPFRPYMVRQLTAAIYTHARVGWRRQKREISLELNAGLCDRAYSQDPSGDWDQKLDTEQLLQSLPAAICRLPKRQRQVVIWRYYDQRSFEDIAQVLAIQVSTARSLLRHGLKNVRREVAGRIA